LSFGRKLFSPGDIAAALKFAAENDLDAVRVNYLTTEDGVLGPPEMIPSTFCPLRDRAFNADYRTVNYDQLAFVYALTKNVHVVEFEGEKYVHKFMERDRSQNTFEKKFRHYVQVRE
jgi:hypothetical protein